MALEDNTNYKTKTSKRNPEWRWKITQIIRLREILNGAGRHTDYKTKTSKRNPEWRWKTQHINPERHIDCTMRCLLTQKTEIPNGAQLEERLHDRFNRHI